MKAWIDVVRVYADREMQSECTFKEKIKHRGIQRMSKIRQCGRQLVGECVITLLIQVSAISKPALTA